MPALGYVRLADDPRDARLEWEALLGDSSPTVDFTPGWNVVPRPRREGLTEWDGRDPIRLSISFLIDFFAQNNGVACEASCRMLERMAGIDRPTNEPPLLVLDSGGVIPHDYSGAKHLRWVIEDLKWGDAIRNPEGNRTRQAGTILLLQYVEDERLDELSSAERRRRAKEKRKKGKKNKKTPAKRYIVQSGDTLTKIAARRLGSSKRWREIANLQNPRIRDPKKIHAGQILRMP